jgi:N-acetyl-anhydromuramyl-L-alanine amidase AmpD
VLSLVLALVSAQGSPAAGFSFNATLQSVASVRHVPLPLLQAITYVNVRWEPINQTAGDGGIGPMHIPSPRMTQAAALSSHTTAQVRGDLVANIDAGAALLANLHTSGSDLASWRPAVVTVQGQWIANEVFDALRQGATRTTTSGETITLAPQGQSAGPLSSNAAATQSPDYPSASWIPADPANYTVANRPHDYPVDMIVIHDIEGSAGSAIQAFQDPTRAASAHYVVDYNGQITQMVREHDIAWHAGNWDYNTRAIGIEHAGFAYTPGLYTTSEYQASARLSASICSRWGVPLDRNHVIGHYQVPDPNNPGQFGGVDHHTDPGPYWDWKYYMDYAVYFAQSMPSPPHMVLSGTAYSGNGTATVSWPAARSCRIPVSNYTVTMQPGNVSKSVAGNVTNVSFSGLTNGTNYSFTITATNSDGTDTINSNSVTPGPACATAGLSASPASPQSAGAPVRFTATSSGCANPQYEFWVLDPNGNKLQQPFGGNSWSWDSYHYTPGTYTIRAWANHATADPSFPETYADISYTVTPFSMSHWQAGYSMSGVPTNWVQGQSQTFSVTVTNNGDVTWPSTGFGEVDLDLHFASSAGGAANSGNWLNSLAYQLPGDVNPGASVTVSVTFTAPSSSGPMVLEAEMIKEHEFWYQQWAPVNVMVVDPARTATYDLSKVPTTWVAGQTQTFPVTVTNTSNQTWISSGYSEVDLDLHFTSAAGGYTNQGAWLNSQAFALPSNVAPGGSVTVNVTFGPPSGVGGTMLLEAEMIKEHTFWFQQWSSVSVNVTGPTWSASYDMSKAPTAWVAGQTQTFPVTVTNNGNQAWPSTGYTEVDLDLHFATSSGGASNQGSWLTSQAFALPGNVQPGGSVTVSVTVTAPSTAGSLVLEATMIKEHQFWFKQSAPINVTVSGPIWSAQYDLTQAPTAWTAGQSKTFSVTITNTGNQTWPSTGYTEVDIDFHFTTVAGGSTQQSHWLTSQAFSIPANLAPGASVTVSVTVTAPSTKGSMFLEAEMIKEHQFWFTSVGSVSATVS